MIEKVQAEYSLPCYQYFSQKKGNRSVQLKFLNLHPGNAKLHKSSLNQLLEVDVCSFKKSFCELPIFSGRSKAFVRCAQLLPYLYFIRNLIDIFIVASRKLLKEKLNPDGQFHFFDNQAVKDISQCFSLSFDGQGQHGIVFENSSVVFKPEDQFQAKQLWEQFFLDLAGLGPKIGLYSKSNGWLKQVVFDLSLAMDDAFEKLGATTNPDGSPRQFFALNGTEITPELSGYAIQAISQKFLTDGCFVAKLKTSVEEEWNNAWKEVLAKAREDERDKIQSDLTNRLDLLFVAACINASQS